MIVVAGTTKIKPGTREQAVEAALEMAKCTQTETGCISYQFYGDLQDPHTFFVFEEWETEADLMKHFETEHMQTFQTQIAQFAEGMEIKKYIVESAMVLG